MKIGIRCHDLCKGSIDEVISKCKEHGFSYLQLVFKKALIYKNKPMNFTKENAKLIGAKLKEADIKVAMLGAYFNPVHRNKFKVLKWKKYFEEHLKYASFLDCEYVGTETGSYNNDKWTYNPKNQTEEGYKDTMKTFKELVKVAEKYDKTVLMEPAWGHVIFSVEQLKRAVTELNSKNVKVTIDIFNLLNNQNYNDYKDIFENACKTFGKDIKIFHLKDFYVKNNQLKQCGLGKGMIDFKFIIEKIHQYSPEATMIFEGVTGDDIKHSLELIKSLNIC